MEKSLSPNFNGFELKPRKHSINPNPILVASLINSQSHCRDSIKLRNHFQDKSSKAIMGIPLNVPSQNKLEWCRNVDRFKQCSTPFWWRLWKLKIHERLKILLLKVAVYVLPTNQRLARYVSIENDVCSFTFCDVEREFSLHLFQKFPLAKAVVWVVGVSF